MERPEKGMVCRHHSGKVYTVLHVAYGKRGRTQNKVVVYMGANGNVWVRPVSEFRDKFTMLFDGKNIVHEVKR